MPGNHTHAILQNYYSYITLELVPMLVFSGRLSLPKRMSR